MCGGGKGRFEPALKVLRVARGNGRIRILLNLIHPMAELVQGDVQSGFFAVFEGGLGRLDEILSRLFLFHILEDRLFHEVVRSALLQGGQDRDPIAVRRVEFDRDGPERPWFFSSVLLRLAGVPPTQKAKIVSDALAAHGSEMRAAFSVITDKMLRIRPNRTIS